MQISRSMTCVAMMMCLMGCGAEVDIGAEVRAVTTAPANPCTDPDTTGVKVIPPTSGVYHGAFLGFTDSAPATDAAITAFENLAGKRLALVYLYNEWGQNGALNLRFPSASVSTIWNHGAVPFIRFMPRTTTIEYQADPVIRLKTFVDTTSYDAQVRAWLLAAKATRIPLLVQFGVEVNGYWFPWNGYWNGKGTKTWHDTTQADGPEAFRLAFQKVVTMAQQNNVWNITWAIHYTHWPEPSEVGNSWNLMKGYYPGDAYVDWIGISTYGEMFPYRDPYQWNPYTDLLGTGSPQIANGKSAYQEMTGVTTSTTKPFGQFEIGVVDDPPAGDKATWIRDAYGAIGGTAFPRMRMAIWWNERWDNDPPLGPSDLRIDSSSSALSGYRAAVANARYVATPVFRCTRQPL